MEEISSLDSFHTDGGESTVRPESEPLRIDENSQASEYKDGEDNIPTVDGGGGCGDGDVVANREAKPQDDGDGNEEEFEQISEDSFDVDDNSQVTADDSTRGGVSRREPDTHEDQEEEEEEGEGDVEKDNTGNVTGSESLPTAEAAVTVAVAGDSTQSRRFEEVDANVSSHNQSGVDENDILGQADNTVPQEGEVIEEEAPTVAEIQDATDAADDNIMEVDPDDEEDEADADAEPYADAANRNDEIPSHSNSPTPRQNEKLLAKGDNENQDESMEDPRVEEQHQQDEETNPDKDVVDMNDNANKDLQYNDDENGNETRDGNNEVTVEPQEEDDEPVENVQEPEESDVCLIPDDTENEVTEAEKEQAILARENAEKEDAEQDASEVQSSEKVSDDNQNFDEQHDPATNDSAEAQANKQAGAEAQVASNVQADENVHDESENNNETENADADEPLLEELHTTSSETGTATAKTIIGWIVKATKTCRQCNEEKICGFRMKVPETSEIEYLCEQSCCDALMLASPGKYFIRRKKFLLEELPAQQQREPAEDENEEEADAATVITHDCLQCHENKCCKYFFKQDDDNFYICNDDCFNSLNGEEPDKFKLKRHSIRVRNIGATTISGDAIKKSTANESRVVARTAEEAEAARSERAASFTRRCSECFRDVTLGDKNLMWETMDFCNEICLGKFQRNIGSNCQTCQGDVPHNALGKYCVRFGFEIRQFCCAACLNEYKKGLKTCSCCQKDISGANEGFLAPVGDKEQFKDFCSQACMRRYDNMANPKKKLRNDTCGVCNNEKPVRVEIILDDKEHTFCSNPCFSAFKFVSNIVADQCGMCCKYFERKANESFTIYSEKRAKVFCSRICLNVYIVVNRHIVSCQWCKVKKYNFDMIVKQHDNEEMVMCSLNCLTLYGVSINAFSRTVTKCDNCSTMATPQYHLTMSDASMRNFCTYQCVMQFQSQFARAPLTLDNEAPATSVSTQQQKGSKHNSTPFPTGLPKRVKLKINQQNQGVSMKIANKSLANNKKGPTMPVISTVSSLASGETETMIGNVTVRRTRVRGGRKVESPPPLASIGNNSMIQGRGRPRKNTMVDHSPTPSPPRNNKRSNNVMEKAGDRVGVDFETKVVAVPLFPRAVRNVLTSCSPQAEAVGVQCSPKTVSIGIQTEKDYSNKALIPVPVPIYVPQPMYMYSAPFPVPVPIPLPIPVPIFIPTTRNSAQGIMKEIKKIQDKMPADPFEAELLMMAEMVAEEKRESDSDSEDEVKPDPAVVSLQYNNSVQQVDVTNNSYGEDVLQMALKMATGDYDQPAHTVDLESAMTANTITNPPPGMVQDDSMSHMSGHHMQHLMMEQRGGRGRKRGSSTSPGAPRNSRSPVKRQRLQELESAAQPASQPMQPTEKPDANMCLKYTFGVNAWKQWVMTKNADIEKSSMRRRSFKTELLQMTADELNYSLCLFVKEVRKPNGTEYAPDTIYYLVLGIQQYLYENGRIDNIFTDSFYEQFTDCLDEVARKFSVLYNDSQYIVTRVEEEHLWECKQLGAHSPHVLLSTLMFFNTKHFNLTSVEEHMQLSFSHIMKHWKRNAQNSKSPGNRNVLLRFYPPQAGLDANPRKKKVYEQQENEENPLRCPVRLYEFYLSKCPESVKTRNDVFYLQPERSCVPDSPVWYSTQPLSKESLQKMLHRVKMVKEINIALLTS